ncbi:MAG: hypothetical protein SPJ41_01965 [Candidatus Onthovivens sp.]|nr:hypothetical protein [Candidatus Onthovivens sp.]
MKKDLKSKSKRKWIVGGVLLFGGVALLTTGFATWVIGVNRTTQSNNANVTVQGTENESVKLTVELTDSAITVSEKHTKAPNEIIGTKAEEMKTDFKIGLKITIEAGAAYTSANTITGVAFSWGAGASTNSILDDETETNVTNNNNIHSSTSYRTEGDYTYLDINTPEIAIGSFTDATVSGSSVKKWTYTGAEVEMFKWGTFFGGDSPCTYYNELYNAVPQKITDSDKDINTVYNELTALQTAFMYEKGGTLKPGVIVLKADLMTTPVV